MLTSFGQLKTTTRSEYISEEAHKKIEIMKYLHQDTSLQKSILLKEKLNFEKKQLFLKQKILSQQTAVRSNAIAKRTMQEKWDQLKLEKFKHFSNLKLVEEQAAVTIQKHVRGFLLRIQIEDDFISMIQTKSDTLISDSSKQALNIMLNLGVVLVPATIIIQKAFKRYQIKKKIHRLRNFYNLYLQSKLEAAANVLKLGIRCLINTKTLQKFKFLQYRKNRLQEIKENLSILVIKNYWRFRKFTYRIMRDKILRVKRRQAALQNKEAFAKYLNALGGKLERKSTRKWSLDSEEERGSAGKTDERAENTQNDEEHALMEDEEFLEAQRIQELIKKQIQQKVDKGKVSHGIKDTRQVMVLPLMQEKALKENGANESRVLFSTASAFAKGRNLEREGKKVSRHTLIGSPPSCEHKKMAFYGEVPKMRALFTPEPELRRPSPTRNIDYAEFMAPTIAFNKKKFRASKSESKKRDSEYVPISSNLIVPTIAYSLKQQQKRSLSKQQNWSFKSDSDKYVPGVSNPSYSPIPWKPLPLNKNILVNTDYGKSFYKEKQKANYNIVDFSSRVMTPELPKLVKEDFSTALKFFSLDDF